MGLADESGRMVAGILGGAVAKQVLYGGAADEIQCKQCGHRFRIPRHRKPSFNRTVIVFIIAIVLAVLIFIAGALQNGVR
jgi:hypothetical protein